MRIGKNYQVIILLCLRSFRCKFAIISIYLCVYVRGVRVVRVSPSLHHVFEWPKLLPATSNTFRATTTKKRTCESYINLFIRICRQAIETFARKAFTICNAIAFMRVSVNDYTTATFVSGYGFFCFWITATIFIVLFADIGNEVKKETCPHRHLPHSKHCC